MDYHYELIFIVAGILDTYAIYKVMGVFLGDIIKNKKLLGVSYFLFYIATTAIHLAVDVPAIMIAGNIMGLFLLSLNYQYTYWKRILATVFTYLFLGGTEVVVVLMSGYQKLSLFEQGQYGSVVGMVIIKLAIYIVALVFDKFKGIRSGKEVPVSYWCCIFFVPVSSIFIILQNLNNNILTYGMLTVEILLFLGINFFVFYLYEHLSSKMAENAEHQIQLQRQESALKQYELMKMSMDSIHGFQHDLKNHIIAMNMLVDGGNIQELKSYLEKMAELPGVQEQYVETRNVILDSILNYKIYEAEKLGITIVPKIQFPSDLELNPYDFTTILGNLLDNAIEATQNKVIQLKLRYQKGCMLIKIENDFDGVLERDAKHRLITRKTEKEKHGRGIQNVEKIVEKYNGSIDFEVTDHYFTVYGILYMN